MYLSLSHRESEVSPIAFYKNMWSAYALFLSEFKVELEQAITEVIHVSDTNLQFAIVS